MIENDKQLKEAVSEAGLILQEIQDYLGTDRPKTGRVRFPRGFIRPVSHYYGRIAPFVSDETLRRNLSYNFMLSDIYLWLLNRTDITSVAADMIIKAAIALAGSICESMLRHALLGSVGRGKSYKYRTEHLLSKGFVSAEEEIALNWLWDTRNNIHIEGVKESEYDKYSRADYKRAAKTVRNLVSVLKWTSPGIVDTWMASIELPEGVPWVVNDLPPSSRMKPSAR